MGQLEGTETQARLRRLLADEALQNRRCLYFARDEDNAGDIVRAGLFAETAETATTHAWKLLDHLIAEGDPVSGEDCRDAAGRLRSVEQAELRAAEDYAAAAETARGEGLEELATLLDTLGQARRERAGYLGRLGKDSN